jgi:hypothetical protein
MLKQPITYKQVDAFNPPEFEIRLAPVIIMPQFCAVRCLEKQPSTYVFETPAFEMPMPKKVKVSHERI